MPLLPCSLKPLGGAQKVHVSTAYKCVTKTCFIGLVQRVSLHLFSDLLDSSKAVLKLLNCFDIVLIYRFQVIA